MVTSEIELVSKEAFLQKFTNQNEYVKKLYIQFSYIPFLILQNLTNLKKRNQNNLKLIYTFIAGIFCYVSSI